jgi:hypothetical protein
MNPVKRAEVLKGNGLKKILTQKDLAERFMLNQSTVAKWGRKPSKNQQMFSM